MRFTVVTELKFWTETPAQNILTEGKFWWVKDSDQKITARSITLVTFAAVWSTTTRTCQ